MTGLRHDVRYHGMSDADREWLMSVVSPYKLNVAKDKVPGTNRLTGIRTLWDGRFDRLPQFKFWAPSWARWAPVITVDRDRDYDHDIIRSLPVTPNKIGINRRNGHSQYVFGLESPVYGQGHTRAYYDWVARRLTRAIGGDKGHSRYMARNPWDESGDYEWHSQHRHRFTLGEIDSVIEEFEDEFRYSGLRHPQATTAEAVEPEYDEQGFIHRQLYLFETTRLLAYQLRGQGRTVTPGDLMPFLRSEAAKLALIDPRPAHPESVLHSIAQSIARFCNTRMSPGNAGLGGSSYWSREQLAAGGKTQGTRNAQTPGHMERMAANSAKSRKADASTRDTEIRMLLAKGYTHEFVANLFGVSTKTVQRALKAQPESGTGHLHA